MKAEGVLRYPVRADYPVSWSSHLDVAEVAERLLTDTSVTGVVGVGQLPGLRGADLAAGFSEQFGRTISFDALTPEAFGKLIEPMFGPAAANVVGFYQALSQVPDNVIAEVTSAQRLLGLTHVASRTGYPTCWSDRISLPAGQTTVITASVDLRASLLEAADYVITKHSK
nr:hypothetical protein [Mesorhizobium loti]